MFKIMNKNASVQLRPLAVLSLFAVSSILNFLIAPSTAFAGLILGAEIKGVYEDNASGSLSNGRTASGSGMNSGGGTMMQAKGMGGMGGMGGSQPQSAGSASRSSADFSSEVSTEAGGFMDLGAATAFFTKGFAQRTTYNKFSEFNSTSAGASAGASISMGDGMSGLLSFYGKVKRYGDANRNSTAYGASFNLKQKPLPALSLGERIGYEDNRADAASFSYRGTMAGITAGYEVTATIFLLPGYSYLVQDFSTFGSKLVTTTASLGLEKRLAREWSIEGAYDLQSSKPDGGTAIRDNILSLALRYNY